MQAVSANTRPARSQNSVVEAALVRALRDIADGHLTVWRSADGKDYADRTLAGAPFKWWELLAERGQYLPPDTPTGAWRLLTS
jgi:hypothetical protein